MQTLQSVYKLVGSLELLGNPASFISDVRGGVKQFFYEPRKGLVKSPAAFASGLARGTYGLAGGVVGGTTAAFVGAASAVTRNVGFMAGQLAFDPLYNYRQQLAQQQ